MGELTKATGARAQQRQGRTVAEWVSLAVSTLILVALFGTLTYLHLQQGDQPALVDVRLQPESTRGSETAFFVPVEMENVGARTAEDVRATLALELPDGRRHLAEVRAEFLAGHGTHRGAVGFPVDPRLGRLVVESISYSEP